MMNSRKEKIKVLSVDSDAYPCPRCGTLMGVRLGMNVDNFGKLECYCPNDSFSMEMEISKYGFIPVGYLHNIEKGILDRSEGWYEKWDLKEKKDGTWILKRKKEK